MDKKVAVAQALLNVGAVKLNVAEPFTFTSGIKSPIYCDNRKMIGSVEERNTIIEGFIELLNGLDFDVVAGTATAGIPWAAFIADRINKPMAYIRSKPKDYGAGKQIEGPDVDGKKVVVIEDLISTGGSVIKAVEAVRKEGGIVTDVAAIFSYEFAKAVGAFEEAKTNLVTITNFPTLLQVAKDGKIIDEAQLELASQWNKSPDTWGK